MHPSVYIIGFIIIAILTHYFFFGKKSVVHSAIRRTKGRKISDVKDGDDVTITGKIVYAGRTITAPLSKRECVYYHVKVKDSSHYTDTFKNYIDIEEEKAGDVVIFDGEHYAIINTKGVSAYVIKDEEFYSGFWSKTIPEVKAFLARHGERQTDFIGGSLDLRAQEGVVEEGEKLTVAGKATWRNPLDFHLKLAAKKILYIEPAGEYGVYMTDDPYVDL